MLCATLNTSDIIAALALLVAVFSLAFSWRDRARLICRSDFLPQWNDNAPQVRVTVVNAGRRPTILRLWVGAETSGTNASALVERVRRLVHGGPQKDWVGTFMGKDKKGLRLEEHDMHELVLLKDDLFEATPNGDVLVQHLWFEDTLGRRYKVKNSRANLAKLWAT